MDIRWIRDREDGGELAQNTIRHHGSVDLVATEFTQLKARWSLGEYGGSRCCTVNLAGKLEPRLQTDQRRYDEIGTVWR